MEDEGRGIGHEIPRLAHLAIFVAGLTQRSMDTMVILAILNIVVLASFKWALKLEGGPLFMFLALFGIVLIIVMFGVAFVPLFM